MSTSIFIFLGIVFGLVFLARLLRIGTLIAFLLAGIIAGPYVLNLWQISDIWSFLGEIGITFLWFVIGLELNMKRLWSLRRDIFGFGAAQVMMVAIILFPILFGLTTWTIAGTIMVSLMLAMSSTSSDLQVLADRNELQTNVGRQTFSILLFQDLLSIPLLAMLPIFAGHSFNLGGQIIDFLVMSAGLVFWRYDCRALSAESIDARGGAVKVQRGLSAYNFVEYCSVGCRFWLSGIAACDGRILGGNVVF